MPNVKLSNVRLAFPAIWEPKAVNGEGAPRFSAAFPIQPKSENAKALDDAMRAVAITKWGQKALPIFNELRLKGRVAFREAALAKDGETYEGFEGMFTLNASNKTRPTILDRDRSPLTEADGRPYAGCYVHAIVEVWAQDNQWGKRINCTLKGLQFVRDGEAFAGGAAASENEFDDLSLDDADLV